ncbi:MAG: metallophosphoesterase [Planctomycetota bacterium]|nr:metallophosphoesterase [Planctomycetota bacterium]
MDSTIRWLHLTDLHVGMSDQDWLWPRMRGNFRDDLQKIRETAGPWDLVLFTGDLVQTGTEYAKLEQIFGEIWGWFQDLGCEPQLLAVPGNHDLQWRDAEDPAVRMLQRWAVDSKVRDGFWAEPSGKYRQVIKDAFAGYETWWQGTPRKPDGIQPGLLPGDFSCTVTKGGLRLGIVGLNSAFLQLTEKKGGKGYQGQLTVDPRQFHAACGDDGVKWAESHDACFLMTHHPPDWLNKESCGHLNSEVLESFCLHLCGHNHQTQVLQELAGGAQEAPVRWLGRSLFGLEKARNGKLNRSHGYVAGELRVADDGRGQLQFMPRQRVLQGTAWRLVPDHDGVNLPDDRRTRVFPVRLRRAGTPRPLRPPGDAKALFRRVVDTITGVLKANPVLRENLTKALKSDDPTVRAAATDIVDIIFADGLYAVLIRFVNWMQSANTQDYSTQLVTLVEAFSALGVPPDRIQALRQNLDSRRVDIADKAKPATAAMIAASALDIPMQWVASLQGLDASPKRLVRLSQHDVPYAGNDSDSILFELKKRLIASLDLDVHPNHPDAMNQLRQRLGALWDMKKPALTILHEDEAAMKVLDEMDDAAKRDWRSLLVLRKKPSLDDVIPNAVGVSTVLQEILAELRRRDGAPTPGADRL